MAVKKDYKISQVVMVITTQRGWVCFSGLGLGFEFQDPTWVRSWVSYYWAQSMFSDWQKIAILIDCLFTLNQLFVYFYCVCLHLLSCLLTFLFTFTKVVYICQLFVYIISADRKCIS